jgi:holliday junction DNA helicase RuvB
MSDTERFFTSTLQENVGEDQQSLRPQKFADFPGQESVKERLEIFVEAAKKRDEPLGHFILSGPPGLGKTTLAYIVAVERDKEIKTSSGPVLEKPGDLAGLLTSLQEGDILFIDEIHRLPITIEEYLYSAMEDFFIDIMIDQGIGARSVRLNVPKFTLIGATTRLGLISAPLRSRCQHVHRLDYYNAEDLETIVTRSSGILNCDINKDAALEVARRSRGTPRIANNLLHWVRDYAQVRADGEMSLEVAKKALDMLNISSNGLDEMDKRILEAMAFNFGGKPIGIKNIAVSVGEEPGTIEDVYEPYLIQEGYLIRTPQGRALTEKSRRLLGMDAIDKGSAQGELF